MAADPFLSPLVSYPLNDEQNATVWKDTAGRYNLNPYKGNARGYPLSVPGYRQTNNGREFTRADQVVSGGNVFGTQQARNDIFDPAILSELSVGEWTCGFWYKRTTPSAAETNTAGYVFAVNGIGIVNPSSTNNFESGVAATVRVFSVGGSGILPGTFQFLWQVVRNDGNFNNGSVSFSTYQSALDVWTHITIQKRLVAGNVQGALYANGIFQAPTVNNTLIANGNLDGANRPSKARISLGALSRPSTLTPAIHNMPVNPLHGAIADVRIWRGLLSDAEILKLATPPFRSPVLSVTYPGF